MTWIVFSPPNSWAWCPQSIHALCHFLPCEANWNICLCLSDHFSAFSQDTVGVAPFQPAWLKGFEDEVLSTLWNQSGKVWQSLLTEQSDEAEPEKVVVVVGHPAAHIALMGHCLNLTKEWMGSFHLDAGSVSVIDFPDGPAGRGVIRCINYTAHLGRWSIPITRSTVDDEEF